MKKLAIIFLLLGLSQTAMSEIICEGGTHIKDDAENIETIEMKVDEAGLVWTADYGNYQLKAYSPVDSYYFMNLSVSKTVNGISEVIDRNNDVDVRQNLANLVTYDEPRILFVHCYVLE